MPKSEPLVATIDLCLSEDSQTEDLSASVNPNMQTDQEGTTSTAHKKKPEPTDSKLNVNRKSEKKGDCKDKPRIVLTFRSEKTGAKSSNMKIVSTEEKQEEISPRRSTRLGTKGESDYECDVSIKSEKTKSQSEDDTPETTTPKRSTRWRNKDSWDNVLANAIARKENYNEMPSGSVQRPSRRIKPTAKVIANQEMSESQSKLPDEGIRTRSTRSTARLSAGGSEKKASKEPEDVEDMDVDNMPNPKLEHFTGLGLKAINSKDIKEDSEEDVEVEDEVETASPEGDEEEIDDDTEVINQLLEEDDTSDDDYSITEDVVEYKVRRPKRKAAQVEKEEDLPIAFRLSKRRESAREYSCRASKYSKTVSGPPTEDEEEDVGDAANGEAGVEAACPADESKIAGACLCEAPSNVHAAPGDLPEPVFCQAIGMVDEVRVGCSHPAARDAAGELRALLRAGLRAPYFLACTQHVMQLRKHMCCPTCGLFCTQGTFYQCSGGHLFHLECGLGSALPAAAGGGGGAPGCPHCGVWAARWLPVNHAVSRVQLDMQCSNKRIFLPEQREQCTPAYLSFPTINSIAPPEGPIIPEDLIPAGFDTKLEKLLEATAENEVDDVILEQLRDSIVAGDTDELIPKIISAKPYINQPIDASGATLAHVAAKNGRLFALHALRCAGAGVDARNCSLNTPLMCAITELLESSHTESGKNKTVPKVEPVKCEESMDVDNENNSKSDAEIADDKITKAEEVKLKPSEDSVTKVPVEDDDVKEEIVKEEIVKKEIVNEEIVKEDIVEEAKEKDADTEQKLTAIVEVKSPKSEEDVSKNLVEAKTDIDDLMKTDDVPVEEQIDEPIKKIIDKTKADELLKVIRYLVNASSDIDIAGPDGLTALHLAAEFGSARVCNIILSESAADINAKDQAGWTPLAYATENHPDVVKELLSQGADASVPDNEGSTALQWAAWTGNARCLQLLAAAPSSDAPVARVPVDLDHVNVHGDTALHIAARNGFYPCVAILLAHGARTDLENSNKQLAIDEASGACRAAISLQMQLAIRRGERRVRRVLASDISNGREPHPIPCINEVDDAELPTDFTYVTDHVMPEVVTVDHTLDTMKGCSCTDDCSSGSCECTSLSVRRWFVRGRLLPSFPHREPPMLLECNATCRCNAKRCVNSVVSNLSRGGSVFARCEVYRAGGARGWGLRTRGAVPRGAPVALYVGELLLPTAADTRSPDTYMLALDVKPDLLEECVDKRQLCVDACRYGNAARFMNHSCRPSLAVLRVLRGARDVRLPAALLVATRALPPHTALTFDYGDKFWSVKSKWISCECGELECRYNNNADE